MSEVKRCHEGEVGFVDSWAEMMDRVRGVDSAGFTGVLMMLLRRALAVPGLTASPSAKAVAVELELGTNPRRSVGGNAAAFHSALNQFPGLPRGHVEAARVAFMFIWCVNRWQVRVEHTW